MGLFTFILVTRHLNVVNLYDKVPKIGENVLITPSALVAGDVVIGQDSSVLFGATIRGLSIFCITSQT